MDELFLYPWPANVFTSMSNTTMTFTYGPGDSDEPPDGMAGVTAPLVPKPDAPATQIRFREFL